ncbi:PREDICTED: protein argonaute 2-like [Nicotiana attenuata]|uniref:protein argonaute 2-like n=1 Tax=Nicotiana attenuata TaxID=49451 RepID=UPI000904DA4E|nr:PREDICTED: protein argonaute 2-like [Nicotiana attenuata]
MDKLPYFKGESIMLKGVGVNHPNEDNSSSMAAVVGTVTWPATNQYATRICPQENMTEKIKYFGIMCKDPVSAYKGDNLDVGQSKGSISNGNVTPEEPSSSKKVPVNSKVRALVQESGAEDVEIERLKKIHFNDKGTSRPVHYHVLLDENAFGFQQLQKLVYEICFTLAYFPMSVKLVPPIFYADLVAFRGRLFHEVVMEKTKSAEASGKAEHYNVHHDLQNTMFFF